MISKRERNTWAFIIASGLLLARTPAHAAEPDIVECKFYTRTVTMEREVCHKLVGTSYKMHELIGHGDAIAKVCVADLKEKFPNKTENDYLYTCNDLLTLVVGPSR